MPNADYYEQNWPHDKLPGLRLLREGRVIFFSPSRDSTLHCIAYDKLLQGLAVRPTSAKFDYSRCRASQNTCCVKIVNYWAHSMGL